MESMQQHCVSVCTLCKCEKLHKSSHSAGGKITFIKGYGIYTPFNYPIKTVNCKLHTSRTLTLLGITCQLKAQKCLYTRYVINVGFSKCYLAETSTWLVSVLA